MRKKAVVIGAGFSGLSGAALLARDGWEVAIIEKNRETGGRARSWRQDGFTFDMGPSWYLMPEVFDRFFSLFGVKRDDYYRLHRLDPYYKLFFGPKENTVITPSLQKTRAVFEHFEEGGAAKFDAYLAQSKYKYDVAMKEFLYRDYTRITDFFNRRLLVEGLKLNVFQKLDKFVERYFHDRRAKQILEYAMVFLGTSPYDAPALYSIMSHVDLDLGVFYPEGGLSGAADAIRRLAEEIGAAIYTEHEVTGFKMKKDSIEAVVTDSGEFEADAVLSSADYHHTETVLVPPEYQNYPADYWSKKKLAPSMFIAYLGLDHTLEGLEHHNLYFSEEWDNHFDTIFKKPSWPENPCFYLSCISKTDHAAAPKGHENVFLLIPTAPGLDDNDDFREQYFEEMAAHIKQITGQSITEGIKVKRLFSGRDFQQDYNAYRGTALGLAHTLNQTAVFRPAHKNNKIANLYYTGHYTHPGVGVPMTLIASELAALQMNEELGR